MRKRSIRKQNHKGKLPKSFDGKYTTREEQLQMITDSLDKLVEQGKLLKFEKDGKMMYQKVEGEWGGETR